MYTSRARTPTWCLVRDPRARGWPTASSSASSTQPGTPAIPKTELHVQVDFYKQQRLDVAHRAGRRRPAASRRKRQRPGQHAVRHVPGRGRALEQRRLDRRPDLRRRRRAATQDARGQPHRRDRSSAARTWPTRSPTSSTTTARSSARNDWDWRAESGDWRFFYFDVPKAPPAGTLFLTRHDVGRRRAVHGHRHADLRAVGEQYQLFGGDGPVRRAVRPRHRRRQPEHQRRRRRLDVRHRHRRHPELVTAPAQEGLHAVVQHQVGLHGDKFDVPFTTHAWARRRSRPSSCRRRPTADTGSFDVTFKSGSTSTGSTAEAFGLSQPSIDDRDGVTRTTRTTRHGERSSRTLTIAHASRLTVSTATRATTSTSSWSTTPTVTASSRTARSSPRRRRRRPTSTSS